jgi:hypothetical protein
MEGGSQQCSTRRQVSTDESSTIDLFNAVVPSGAVLLLVLHAAV